jgi:hypothetical protein
LLPVSACPRAHHSARIVLAARSGPGRVDVDCCGRRGGSRRSVVLPADVMRISHRLRCHFTRVLLALLRFPRLLSLLLRLHALVPPNSLRFSCDVRVSHTPRSVGCTANVRSVVAHLLDSLKQQQEQQQGRDQRPAAARFASSPLIACFATCNPFLFEPLCSRLRACCANCLALRLSLSAIAVPPAS